MAVEGALYWFADANGDGERTVLDARTGARVAGIERAHAIALARHYAGLPQAEVRAATPVTAFGTDYPSVNRLLPVWEVRLETPDGLTLYVETGMDRLAAVTNDQRRVLLFAFQTVHTLSFLERVEWLRVAVLTGLILTVLATTALGAALLLQARGRGVRRLHALAAWVAAPLVLAFTLSGLFHLLVSGRGEAPLPAPRAFAVAALEPLEGLSNARLLTATAGPGGAPIWRIAGETEARYRGMDAPDTDEARARSLAGVGAEAPVSAVTRFGEGYSLINKRLPVWRVETPEGPVFADVQEGLIAAAPPASALTRLESWTFSTIHKWEFLTPLGRRTRDYATMTATLIIALTALFGLALVAQRARTRRPERKAAAL